MMGDLLGGFPGSMWTRTKHIGKACGELWVQSSIFHAIPSNCARSKKFSGCYRWYQS